MNRRVHILLVVLFLGLIDPAEVLCQDCKGQSQAAPGELYQPHHTSSAQQQYPLHQVLDSLRCHAELRIAAQQAHEANLHVMSEVEVLHKGLFPRLMPYLNKAKLSEGLFTQEYVGTLKSTVQTEQSSLQNAYTDSITITLTPLSEVNSLIVSEFTQHITSLSQRINLYSQYIYGNIYSPMAYSSGKYYNFSMESVWVENGDTFYKIAFNPKITNYKFVEGYMVISQDGWHVREMHISGNVEFIEYTNVVYMGEQGSPLEYLPTQLNVKIKGNFLGTKVKGECIQLFDYTRIGDKILVPDSHITQPQQQESTQKTLSRAGFLVKDHTLTIKDKGNLYIAPLVSPLLFHYSTHSGLSYTQKLKYSRQLSKERIFTLAPLIGYNFKYNELYWAIKGDFLYSPSNKGRIFIDAGNGVPQDFRTSYAKLGHTIEVFDNLSLTTTAAQLRYTWLNKEDHPDAKPSYTTFAPEVELQYHKPGYPTVTLGYAHSIKGIIGSDVEFGRAEIDIQHKIDIGPLHTLMYRAGMGIAFDYNYLYFAQFKNLKNNHLPYGWNDDIGGTFNLLTSVKYYEIDKYLRANVQYDAPLLLVPTLLKRVKSITKERLYCNLLLVDTMSPYVEMGYGIGTNIFNMGIFWGGEIDKWDRIGVKFTFELFN